MSKRFWTAAVAAVMTASVSLTAFAGEWKQDGAGWWWQNDDGSYPVSCWQWIDGNGDGVAESYCFDANGYMYANTTTPDGYTVNADGAWVVNGAVQTQTQTSPQKQTQTQTPPQEQTQGSQIRLPRTMEEMEQQYYLDLGYMLDSLYNTLGDETAVCRTLTANLRAMISEMGDAGTEVRDSIGVTDDMLSDLEASGDLWALGEIYLNFLDVKYAYGY